MSELSALREEAGQILGASGLLRRDRTCAALFVSDFPARGGDVAAAVARLRQRGFEARPTGKLLGIDLCPTRWAELIARIPVSPLSFPPPTDETLALWSLARRLAPVDTLPLVQPINPIRLTMLCLDAKEFARLGAELPPLVAELLRLKQPLPQAAGLMILRALNARRKEPSI